MIDVVKSKIKKGEKAKLRSKKNLKVASDRPRMVVFRSNKYIYVQVMDDLNHKVLCSVSSISKELKDQKLGKNIQSASVIGKEVAKKLKALNIGQVVFDRNGYRYHGKVKALADGCRAEGINF
jgi:large subunit ribosomal protein L18